MHSSSQIVTINGTSSPDLSIMIIMIIMLTSRDDVPQAAIMLVLYCVYILCLDS